MTDDPLDSPLAWWRCLDPSQLVARRHVLLNWLVARTAAPTLQGLIGHALAGESAAGVTLATALDDAHPDLTASWLAWAAAMGNRLAILGLGARLQARHAAAVADCDDRGETVAPDDAALADRAAHWRHMVRDCDFATAHGRTLIAKLLDRQQEREAAMDGEVAEEADAEDAAAPAGSAIDPGPPHLIVVAAIGATHGRESAELAKAYAPLTAPLPLAGLGLKPETLAAALDLEFPWMTDVTAAIRDDLALRRAAGVPWMRLYPLLLVGPPGVGKTRFAQRLAMLAGTGYGVISAAGSSDNRMLQGTARGWASAQPAFPLILMRRCGTANPVIVVDEIDKAEASRNGDVRATLLALLERETARAWHDECLLAACDLGEVSWILTANVTDTLPPPLLSRLRVVRVEAPKPAHFDAVLDALLRDLAAEFGIAESDLPPLAPDAEAALRREFARGRDLRRIKSALARALGRGAGCRSPQRH